MGFGSVLWNTAEYLAYLGIIIQTGFMLLGQFGYLAPANTQTIDGYLDKAADVLGKIMNASHQGEGQAPPRRRRP